MQFRIIVLLSSLTFMGVVQTATGNEATRELQVDAEAILDTTLTRTGDTVVTDMLPADTVPVNALPANSLPANSLPVDTLPAPPPEPEPEVLIYKDSARLAIEAKTRQAWRRSMIVPGWGQISNGGLWWIKVPVIYGGFVSTGLIFEFNNRHYREVLREVQYRLSNNHAYPPGSTYEYIGADPQGTEYLISWKDYHRRMRDISVLATVGWYALNVIEAYVDSMLKNRWEIDDRLTLRYGPSAIPPPPFTSQMPLFGFNIKFDITN